ncbi:hypothetical protein BDR26DRAFT_849309 [Obelidium mucronatum]|nr:hypothetical protein BDR26DRAFT_849309 [Obelidium mucronatum]
MKLLLLGNSVLLLLQNCGVGVVSSNECRETSNSFREEPFGSALLIPSPQEEPAIFKHNSEILCYTIYVFFLKGLKDFSFFALCYLKFSQSRLSISKPLQSREKLPLETLIPSVSW